MSGAEVIAVIGVGASVIQVVDACTKVCSRIQAFRDHKGFHDIAVQLPLLCRVLCRDIQSLNTSECNGGLDESTTRALVPVLDGCRQQLEALDTLIQNLIPSLQSSKLRRTLDGIRSFRKEPKIREILSILADYKSTINLHLTSRLTQSPYRNELALRMKSPVFDVTAQKIAHFVGRSLDLEQIASTITASTTNPAVVVLTGIGGQGKTQTALEYCHKSAAKYHGIFWVDATAEFCTVRNFERIATRLGMPNISSADNTEKVQWVKDTLRNWTEPWLLVFDNYDDPDAFSNIASYFPSSVNSHRNAIIVTSRHDLCDRLGSCVKLEGMAEQDACDLLCSRCLKDLPSPEDLKQAQHIAKTLGYLALAIDQAGAYISHRHLSLRAFSEHYEQRKQDVLQYTPGALWEYRKRSGRGNLAGNESAFTTWEMSFEQISKDAVHRGKLEAFITQAAYFDPTNVKEILFRNFVEKATAFSPCWKELFTHDGKWDSFKYRDVVASFLSLSIIQAIRPGNAESNSEDELRFSIHPLIVEWLQLRSSIETRRSYVNTSIAMTALTIDLEDSEELSLNARQGILGTMDACLRNSKQYLKSEEDKIQWSGVKEGFQTTFATFYSKHDRYSDAEKLFLEALNFEIREYSEHNINTLRTMNNMGVMFLAKKEFDKSENWLTKSLTLRQEFLGPNYAITKYTDINFANLILAQFKVRMLQISYSTDSLLDYLVAHTWQDNMQSTIGNFFGEVYLARLNLDIAKWYFCKALRHTCEDSNSAGRIRLFVLLNLALVFRLENKHERAEALYKVVTWGRQHLLGASHSLTREAWCEFADFYKENGRTSEAEDLYKKGFANTERRNQQIPDLARPIRSSVVPNSYQPSYSSYFFQRSEMTGNETWPLTRETFLQISQVSQQRQPMPPENVLFFSGDNALEQSIISDILNAFDPEYCGNLPSDVFPWLVNQLQKESRPVFEHPITSYLTPPLKEELDAYKTTGEVVRTTVTEIDG